MILQRIFLAIKNNDAALITRLVNRLPAKDQIIGQRLAKLQQDPTLVLEFASKVKPSEFNRQVILVIFSRFARQSVEKSQASDPNDNASPENEPFTTTAIKGGYRLAIIR